MLIPKINIFGKKKLVDCEWEPTKSTLAQAKSATYEKLQSSKNNNSKQQLMRTQKTQLLKLLLSIS